MRSGVQAPVLMEICSSSRWRATRETTRAQSSRGTPETPPSPRSCLIVARGHNARQLQFFVSSTTATITFVGQIGRDLDEEAGRGPVRHSQPRRAALRIGRRVMT